MECAEIVGASQPLKLVNKPIPEPPDEGMLLKTLYAGVCHSDLHFLDDETDLGGGEVSRVRDLIGDKFTGIVLGHEICGRIEKFGKEVPHDCHFKIGDTVLVFPFIGCRNCEACSAKLTELCENNLGGTTEIGQGKWGGGFSTHVVVPEWQLAVKLPSSIPPEVGCMIPCSAVTSYTALLKAKPFLDLGVRLRGVANLLIVGLGGLGSWTVVLMKSIFCDKNVRVIGMDTKKEILDSVIKLGADDIIHSTSDTSIEEKVANVTMNGYNMMDAVIDYVGNPETQEVAVESLHRGGTAVIIGLAGGVLPLSLVKTVTKSLTIQGSRVANIGKLKDLVDLMIVQNIEQFPQYQLVRLEDINDVLEQLRRGAIAGRAVIKFE